MAMSKDELDYIKNLFNKMDIDQNGRVGLTEFLKACCGQGYTRAEAWKMMVAGDKDGDGMISLSEFEDIIQRNLETEESRDETDMVIQEIRKEIGRNVAMPAEAFEVTLSNERKKEIENMFLLMDADEDGFVDQQNFEKYCFTNDVGLGKDRIEELYKTIRDLDLGLRTDVEQRGITIKDLMMYFELNEAKQLPDTMLPPDMDIKSIGNIEEYIDVINATGTNVCNNTVEHIAAALSAKSAMLKLLADTGALSKARESFEVKRWKPFASFRRKVHTSTVMHAPTGIIKDLLPGQFDLKDLASVSDLPPIEPQKTVIYGVQWVEGNLEDGNWNPISKIIFPNRFDGKIKVDLATTETLRYYNALLVESTQQKVDLESRHVLQDFTYSDDYFDKWVANPEGANGPALEHHKFAHLDMNLSPIMESGHFVLAKFLNEEKTTLAITGFKVPTRHTIFTPADVLHTNNYLRGTWRTMLADGVVNEGKLIQNNKMFRLTFE